MDVPFVSVFGIFFRIKGMYSLERNIYSLNIPTSVGIIYSNDPLPLALIRSVSLGIKKASIYLPKHCFILIEGHFPLSFVPDEIRAFRGGQDIFSRKSSYETDSFEWMVIYISRPKTNF